MSYHESIREIATKFATKYPSDIERAVKETDHAVRQLEDFEDFVGELVHNALQALVYQIRHHHNVGLKRQEGQYGGGAKVQTGKSEGVGRAAVSAYLSYRIGATVLGDTLGADLTGLAEQEAAVASGHAFNARLCSRLAEIVPAEKRVREVVSEKRLKAIWEQVRGGMKE